MVYEDKTKEITTVKGVWKGGLCYHEIWRTFALNSSKNYWCFEKLYQTPGRVFHPIFKLPEVGLKTRLRLVFSTLSAETLFGVFDTPVT